MKKDGDGRAVVHVVYTIIVFPLPYEAFLIYDWLAATPFSTLE